MTIHHVRVSLATEKRPGLLLLSVTLFLFLLTGTSMGQVVDRVIAVVNDDVILLSDLEETGKAYFDKIKATVPEQSRQAALKEARNEVLEGLIEKSLVNQKATKDKIAVTDDELKNAYGLMVERSGLTESQFLDKLKQSGLTKEKYQKNLKYHVLQEKIISHDVRSKIVITDDMVKQYYDTHGADRSVTKGGFSLLQMGFTWGQTPESKKSAPSLYADKLDAKKRAEHAHQLAKEGQDFKELAKKYSNLPSAADGGDIGVFQEDEMAADMREAVIHLKLGDVSDIIETAAGFQFFKLVANKEGVDSKASYESAKNEIRDILYEQQLKKEFDSWVKNLKEQAYIKKM